MYLFYRSSFEWPTQSAAQQALDRCTTTHDLTSEEATSLVCFLICFKSDRKRVATEEENCRLLDP